MGTTKKQLLSLVISVFASMVLVIAEIQSAVPSKSEVPRTDFSLTSKTHIRITNGVQDGANIVVHCKSKDTDLGVHNIAHGESYEWTFHPNIWRTTLYFCQFQWHVKVTTCDIYKYSRDAPKCHKMCNWLVTKGGIFGYDSDGLIDIGYPWNYP